MGRYQGSSQPCQPLQGLCLGQRRLRQLGVLVRGIALSILADLALAVSTLNLPASHGSKITEFAGKTCLSSCQHW